MCRLTFWISPYNTQTVLLLRRIAFFFQSSSLDPTLIQQHKAFFFFHLHALSLAHSVRCSSSLSLQATTMHITIHLYTNIFAGVTKEKAGFSVGCNLTL